MTATNEIETTRETERKYEAADEVRLPDLTPPAGAQAHLDGGSGFTFGLMHGTEAARAERAEQRLPTRWKLMRRPKNTRWLRRYATASGSNDQR